MVMNLQSVVKMRTVNLVGLFVFVGIFYCGKIESASVQPPAVNSNSNSISNSDVLGWQDKGMKSDNSESQSGEEWTDSEYKSLLRNIVPLYMQDILKLNLSQKVVRSVIEDVMDELSPHCVGHSLEWINRIMDPKQIANSTWVLHMIDSWGKVPEGLLSGHVNALGDYDECVELRAKDVTFTSNSAAYPDLEPEFQGRYCNIPFGPKPPGVATRNFTILNQLSRTAVSPGELLDLMRIPFGALVYPSLAVCFPSSCNQGNISLILTTFFDFLNATHVLSSNSLYPLMNRASCYISEKPDFDNGDWSMIGLLGLIGFLCLMATIVDTAMSRSAAKGEGKSKRKPGTAAQLLLAFSLKTNVEKFLSTRSGGDNLGCLHGLRFLSTLWVILAHTWYVVTFLPSWNMVDMKTTHEDWTLLTILNSTISVDTFFVMSGLLVSYNVLKMLQKTNGKLNLPMFYLHRYLRLTPTYAILVGIMATVFPYLGSGPFWIIMDRWSGFCRDYWWTNLLYINNLVHTDTMCQGEAWYLANDMQFYIVSPILIYPLWKWNIPGKIFLGVITCLSIAAPGISVHLLDTTPTTIGTRDLGSWFQDIYITPWSRAQTYIVGVWMGYILFKTKGVKVRIPMLVQIVGWLLSTAIALSVLYGIYPYFDPLTEIPDAERILYACLNRFGFAISIVWIIFMCVHGYGGFINSFLSWKVFIPLGRVTFCTYLVSLHLQMILHLQFRQAVTYDLYTMTNFFFAHAVMSLLAGFICTITMESPFIQIEKLIFSGASSGPRAPPPKPPGQRNGIFYNSTETILNSLSKDKEEIVDEDNNNINNTEDKPQV